MKSPAGHEIAMRVIAGADALVESFGTGVAERLGRGHDALCARFPRVVYCRGWGFGRTGPLGSRPGFALMMQAYSGMMMTTGEEGGGPLRIGFSPLDQTTGIHAATGILAAMRTRDRTGRGAFVEASLFETATAFMGWHAQAYWMTGALPDRPGSGHGSLCPYQAFAAADGYVLIAVGSDGLWRKLCDALGLAEGKDDPRFRTNADRVANRAVTVALVQGQIATRTVDAWMEVLTGAGIPASPINNLDRAIGDPQVAARGMVMEFQHPVGGAMRSVAYPVLHEGVPREIRHPPPLHGEHTGTILTELGYPPDEIAAVQADGIVGPKIR
jgi:formyl-CoA transferase